MKKYYQCAYCKANSDRSPYVRFNRPEKISEQKMQEVIAFLETTRAEAKKEGSEDIAAESMQMLIEPRNAEEREVTQENYSSYGCSNCRNYAEKILETE